MPRIVNRTSSQECQAKSSRDQAQSSRDQAKSSRNQAQSSRNQAQSSRDQAQSSRDQAKSSRDQAKSSRDRQTNRSKWSTQSKLCRSYKFDAKSMSSWQPVSQSIINIALQIIEDNIRKTRDSMPRQRRKKVDQTLAHFYLRATERLKRLKAPKRKISLHLKKNQLHEKLEAARNSLAEINETLEDWSQSCEAIKTKAAELKEFCHAKSFNIQPLIPTIKVNADPQHVEQRLRESHLAYYNGLPSYTVTGTNKSSA